MEDFGADGILGTRHAWYGVFDGHNGAGAARYVSRSIRRHLEDAARFTLLSDANDSNAALSDAADAAFETLPSLIRDALWTAEEDMLRSRMATSSLDDDPSGTTATLVLKSKQGLTVVNVGDSTAIMCCESPKNASSYVKLSVDHTPYLPSERRRVERLGGTVACPRQKRDGMSSSTLSEKKYARSAGGVCRVQGVLAVSRSIGDVHLKPYVSSVSHARQWRWCGHEEFLIVASDGLWDGLSFERASHLVLDALAGRREILDEETVWEAASRGLVEEAFLRATAISDNIMVVVVPL
jgi:protein phosphatase 1L